MEHLNKARELGKAITESEEYRNLIEIEDKIAKIENESGDYSNDEKSELDGLLRDYENAQNEFREMMNDINRIISHYTNITVKKDNCSTCSRCK